MAFTTVRVDLGEGTQDYIGVEGGDGFVYFFSRYMYRMRSDNQQVQKSMNYNDSQCWVGVGSKDGSTGSFDPSGGGGSVAANADVETFVSWCEGIAADNSHGYDQTNRDGPDYDCSSLLWHGLHYAGFDVGTSAFRTYTMRPILQAAGWSQTPLDLASLQRGDILWRTGHTEVYVGQQQRLGAHLNEFGGVTGGRTGDQSGNEISVVPMSTTSDWEQAWRYVG